MAKKVSYDAAAAYDAAVNAQPVYQSVLQKDEPAKPVPLTTDQKNHWNLFVDYLDKNGYKGSSKLDDRNTALGQDLLAKFNQANPDSQITYTDVPRVQQELQNYRQDMINKWKAGKVQIDGVKTADDIMPGLSPADGWLGQQTSSHKFPTAIITNDKGKMLKDYQTDIQASNSYGRQ